MTVHTLEAGMPPLIMIGGYELRLEAIDPLTGDPVADVTVSRIVVNAVDADGSEGSFEAGPFMLVPGPTSVTV